jgi:hypothetical protein
MKMRFEFTDGSVVEEEFSDCQDPEECVRRKCGTNTSGLRSCEEVREPDAPVLPEVGQGETIEDGGGDGEASA